MRTVYALCFLHLSEYGGEAGAQPYATRPIFRTDWAAYLIGTGGCRCPYSSGARRPASST